MLSQELDKIRIDSQSYSEGLKRAKDWVNQRNGRIEDIGNGETKLIVGIDEAICFQLFSDIDKFYYEN